MGMSSKKFVSVVVLAGCFALALGVLATGAEVIQSTDEFVARLEEEYSQIANFSARLSLSGTDPPVSVRVLAVSEPRSLRVEYLSPEEMQGQFFLLKGDFLYQYMPGRNLIIKKDLKGADLPVEAANLTPDYLLQLVRSDDFAVNLIGIPIPLGPDDGAPGPPLELGTSLSGLVRPGVFPYGSDPGSSYAAPFGLDSLFGDYVLELIPKSGDYQFSRQVIQFDPKDFLPRELITYFEGETGDTVYTTVDEVRTNLDLELEAVRALPKDAEIIED